MSFPDQQGELPHSPVSFRDLSHLGTSLTGHS